MILTTGMAHQRKLIRQAVVALLTSANTAAGARVKDTRLESIKKSKLPTLSVYTLHEETDPASAETAPVELTRNLDLEITMWVGHTDEYPATDGMDDLAKQIEDAMAADYYIGNTVVDQMLTSTDVQIVEENGSSDPMVGIMTLTYSVTYRTSQGATATDSFVTANVTQQLVGGVADTVPAVDTFQEPQ